MSPLDFGVCAGVWYIAPHLPSTSARSLLFHDATEIGADGIPVRESGRACCDPSLPLSFLKSLLAGEKKEKKKDLG